MCVEVEGGQRKKEINCGKRTRVKGIWVFVLFCTHELLQNKSRGEKLKTVKFQNPNTNFYQYLASSNDIFRRKTRKYIYMHHCEINQKVKYKFLKQKRNLGQLITFRSKDFDTINKILRVLRL